MKKRLSLLTTMLLAMILSNFTSVQSSPLSLTPSSTTYFVDSINGSDSNSGLSETAPWKSLSKVNGMTFQPGDVVQFKRGSSWTGSLTIKSSGVEGSPITFTSYGSGAAPIITNPGGDRSDKHRGILVYGNWVIVENFLVKDVFDDGIGLWNGARRNIIRNNEIVDAGRGVTLNGQYNLVTGNYIHDLHMVVNTSGGYDDFGASAVNFYDSNNEASYNWIENCKAPSYDYGMDGGAFEMWGETDNNSIHHNWAVNNKGFVEVGGGSARNITIAYNVSLNNGKLTSIHAEGDSMGSVIENFNVENNTIVEIPSGSERQYTIIWFGGYPPPYSYALRNNVIYLKDYSVVADADQRGWSLTHENNLYYFTSASSKVGFSLGAGEKIADPLFIDLHGQDFHLQDDSPATDAGLDLGYAFDFDNSAVPSGQAPDLGAYEYLKTGGARKPELMQIIPNRGAASGGTSVIIKGLNYQQGATVAFNDLPCLDVVVISTTEINCKTPSSVPGTRDVTVTNPDGQSVTKAAGFTYVNPAQEIPNYLPFILRPQSQ